MVALQRGRQPDDLPAGVFGLFALLYAGGFLHELAPDLRCRARRQEVFRARVCEAGRWLVFSYGCTSNMVEQPLYWLWLWSSAGAIVGVP